MAAPTRPECRGPAWPAAQQMQPAPSAKVPGGGDDDRRAPAGREETAGGNYSQHRGAAYSSGAGAATQEQPIGPVPASSGTIRTSPQSAASAFRQVGAPVGDQDLDSVARPAAAADCPVRSASYASCQPSLSAVVTAFSRPASRSRWAEAAGAVGVAGFGRVPISRISVLGGQAARQFPARIIAFARHRSVYCIAVVTPGIN